MMLIRLRPSLSCVLLLGCACMLIIDAARAHAAAQTTPQTTKPMPTPPSSAATTRAASDTTQANLAPAKRTTPPGLQWNEDWPLFRPVGYVLTGVSGAAAIGVSLFVEYPDDAHWHGGILFDDAARDALRARDSTARDAVR